MPVIEANPVASRIALTLLVLVGQALMLFPMWFLWYVSLFLATSWAGAAAGSIAIIILLLCFIALTYPIVVGATHVVERFTRKPTFFAPSFIARRTCLGLFAGLCVAALLLLGVSSLPSDFAVKKVEDLLALLFVVVIAGSSAGSTWIASRQRA